MKTKNSILLLVVTVLCFLPACKPTEKGYKTAYDAALGKRQAALEAQNLDVDAKALQQVDGPQLKNIEGHVVYIMNQRLTPAETVMNIPGNYNVAVGCYKMITNCRAQVEDLRVHGYDAFPVKDQEGLFYTIGGSFKEISEAVNFYEEYKKGKNNVYVGLPEAPVIIYSPN